MNAKYQVIVKWKLKLHSTELFSFFLHFYLSLRRYAHNLCLSEAKGVSSDSPVGSHLGQWTEPAARGR